MAKKQRFELIYDPEVIGHLADIESKYQSLIRSTIAEQLRFEPETTSRNRKQIERPVELGARWELRLGPDNRFRVFYRVDAEQRQVRILAIAAKGGTGHFSPETRCSYEDCFRCRGQSPTQFVPEG